MQKIWNWLMLSSQNPGQIALTVKASLLGAVTILTVGLGFAHIQVGNLSPIVDALIAALQALFGLVSALAVVWGLIRKLYLTIKGQHASLNVPPVV